MTRRGRTVFTQHRARGLRGAALDLCLLLAVVAALPAAAHAAPPDNDAFADAQLVRVGDRITGSTTDATLEASEPAPGETYYTHSIWYRLTPSASERLRIDTCSAGPWAEIAIYTGTTLGTLTETPVTRAGCNSGSRLYVAAAAATTYYIRVTGTDTNAGAVVLNIARPQAPANDHFENAQPIGRPAHIVATNVDATVQPGEPEPVPHFGSGHSVWYKLAATTSDVVVASTCVDANSPIVAVYTGNSVGQLTEVGREGGACGMRTTMLFATDPGTTYYIAVRDFGDGAGEFTLNISANSPPPPPISDAPPPPAPTCPFQFATGLVTYSGTHAGGGAVCLSVTKDFSAVAWFHAIDVPGDSCRIGWHVDHMDPLPTPIVDRRFSYGSSFSRIIGSFPTNRGARGTLQMTRPTGRPGFCNSPTLTWTATTTATPPWVDETPPSLRLAGATVQRPLRSRALVVLAGCRLQACQASASATVAGIRLKSATRTVPASGRRTLRLALSARARRALGAALKATSRVRARVSVVARDAAGNRTTTRRTLTLRR